MEKCRRVLFEGRSIRNHINEMISKSKLNDLCVVYMLSIFCDFQHLQRWSSWL
jgi:hypothetical protein